MVPPDWLRRCDGDAGLDRGAERSDLGRHRAGDGGEVDDSGLRGVQGGDADGVGLDLLDLLASQPAEARDAVLAASAFEFVERGELGRVEGDDELAAALVRDPVLVAVRVERVAALGAELGLQGARACSRCRRGRRRSCGSSGGRRCPARAPGRGRGRPGVRRSSSRAVARPRIPAPTMTTSQGRSISGSRVRGLRRRRGGSRSRSPRWPG